MARRGILSSLGRTSRQPTVLTLAPSLGAISGVSEHARQLMTVSSLLDMAFVHFQVGSEGRRETVAKRVLRTIASPFYLALRIASVQPHIVHINTSLNQKAFWRDAVYLVIAKACGCKVVYQVHGGTLGKFLGARSGIVRRIAVQAMSLPNVVVVLSEKERGKFVATLGKGKKVVVIRNAVNIVQYGRHAGKQYKGTQRRIVFIGRLHRDKGVLDLVEAVSLLKSRGQADISVVIAGSGPHEELIRSRVVELGVQSEVQMIGAVRGAQKTTLWNDADIFVLPSYHEGLPYAVLESLASGTPLITTMVGAIPEILDEGVQALFVEPGQPTMLAEAIAMLASNGDMFHRMSGECLKRAQEEFGIERLAHDIGIVYRGIV